MRALLDGLSVRFRIAVSNTASGVFVGSLLIAKGDIETESDLGIGVDGSPRDDASGERRKSRTEGLSCSDDRAGCAEHHSAILGEGRDLSRSRSGGGGACHWARHGKGRGRLGSSKTDAQKKKEERDPNHDSKLK